MSLTARQKRLYTYTFSIYRQLTPGKGSFSLVAAGVPGYFEYTENLSDSVDGLGRQKRKALDVLDVLHCEITVDLQDTDVIKNTTPALKGTVRFGQVHTVQGPSEAHPSMGARQANKQSVNLMDVPPEAVPAEIIAGG